MHVNTDKLRGKIVECGYTQEFVAKSMGIDRSTFSRKMKNDGLEFTIGEAHALCKILHLTAEEASAIFFAQ